MGLWSDIAGIGAGIGGFIAAPFTGGASIPIGLSAAGSIISSGAVGDAAQKQADATTQALALQKSMYDTTRADLSPYSQTGVAALGNLRQLTGLPAMAPTSGTPAMASTMPPAVGHTPPPNIPVIGQAVPRPAAQTAPNPIAMQTNSGYVTMRAPDGTMQQVDAAHVPFYQQKGAVVL